MSSTCSQGVRLRSANANAEQGSILVLLAREAPPTAYWWESGLLPQVCPHSFSWRDTSSIHPDYAGLLAGVFGALASAEDTLEFSAELTDSGIHYPAICDRPECNLSHSPQRKVPGSCTDTVCDGETGPSHVPCE